MVAPLTFRLSPGGAKLVLARGDLTKFGGCAIVNAANERMLGGGGVDGAIHRAAGPALKAACRAVPEVAPGVRCPTGEARLTIGGDLTARFVIHTGEGGRRGAGPAEGACGQRHGGGAAEPCTLL